MLTAEQIATIKEARKKAIEAALAYRDAKGHKPHPRIVEWKAKRRVSPT